MQCISWLKSLIEQSKKSPAMPAQAGSGAINRRIKELPLSVSLQNFPFVVNWRYENITGILRL